MRDLRAEMRLVQRELAKAPGPDGGRCVLFISARAGEGVSSAAASFALAAAEQARRPVWLVDVDLKRNHLFNTFAVGPWADAYGGVGPPYSASLKTQPFFSVEPEETPPATGLGLFTAHRVGETRVMVTQFDASGLKPGQSVRLRSQPGYWQAARATADWTVVDAPALQLASSGLPLVSQMDAVVLVVRADSTPPAEVDSLRRAVEAHGGRVAGVILNRQKGDARLADRLAQ